MRRLPLALAAIAAVWWFLARPWARDWGATPDERARTYPGDDWIPDADYTSTKAITIHARPEDVWPWLVQIGRGRGGLYSIDWLDRLFRILDAPSADEILPQYQHLEPGDIIPIGGSAGWPVLIADAPHALALAGDENNTRWSWTFALYPTPAGATCLISRNRLHIRNPLARAAVLFAVDGPAGIMAVAMLRGVRRRAESLVASSVPADEAGSDQAR
jgi:hypothetical protein